MPEFEFTSPEGKTYSVTGPEGATKEQAFQILQQQLGSAGTSTPSANISGVSAAGRGIASGLTANFYDELRGIGAAGGLQADEPIGLGSLAIGGAKLLAGNANAQSAYETERNRVRAEQVAAEKQHPYIYGAGNIGGALAALPIMPELTLAKGAGLGARTANAIATGALYGGLYGAGAGHGITDTALEAGVGGGIGALGGAVAPAAIDAIGGLGRIVAAPFRGAINPLKEAQRQLTTVIEANKGNIPTAANAMERANAGGMPLLPVDLGGAYTQALADSAAVRSPAARDALQSAMEPRFQTQNERISGLVGDVMGGAQESAATSDALREAARKANKPRYMAAYNAGDKEIWSPELERLTAAPFVQQALSSAMSKWKNYAVRDGFGAMNPPFRVENGGLIKTGGGMKAYPNIQLWDYAARELQDRAREAPIGSQQAGLFNDLARQLKTELDRLVPSYKVAREGAARFFGAQDALEAGGNFFSSRMENYAAKQALSKMSQPERELFAQGFSSKLLNAIKEVPERSDLLKRQFFSSPAARERIEIAMGPQAARRIEAQLGLESLMERSRQAVSGNSKTVQRLVDAGIAGVGAGYDFATGDPRSIGSAMIIGAMLKTGRREISARVAAQLGKLLSSGNPDDLRQAAQVVSSSPRMVEVLRNADKLIPRAISASFPYGQ